MTIPQTTLSEDAVTASADPDRGEIFATARLSAPPERVFRALTSPEICQWWVLPDVFDTREWSGDVSVGGAWEAAGMGDGQPYRLAGEFLEIEAPRRLAQSWKMVGEPGEPTTVTYDLEVDGEGTRLRLGHSGPMSAEVREITRAGWEASLSCLAGILAAERAAHLS